MKETKQGVASSEARAMAHELMGAFEAFKAANEERLSEIERKRAGDALLEEKVARIDAAVAAANARVERLASEARRPMVGDGGGAVAPSTASRSPSPAGAGEEYELKAAWSGYMRSGAAGLELKAGLSTGPTSGGYVAPPETERLIERRLMQASPMREIATVKTIGSGLYKKPVSTAGVVANWVAETAARPETDPATLTALDFQAFDLYAAPAATQALLDDAFVNLDEWLAAEVEDAFAAQETAAFVTGDGTNKPRGFLAYTNAPDATATWGQIGYLATGVSGGFAATHPTDKLVELIYLPRAQFRPNGRFVMNRKTVSAIRRFKDADGNYVWQPAAKPGQTSSLFGYPVTEVETMPDVGANSFSVAFGDFAKGYLIVDRAGVRVLRDPYTAKPYVLFYTTKRVGGGVQNFDAIKLLKFGTS
jgi:HK97 family phage major capsid protein